MMRTLLLFLSAISLAASGFFAFRLLGLFAPDEYNEFTGIVAMLPAAGCIAAVLFAILFLGISFMCKSGNGETANSIDQKAEKNGDGNPIPL